MLGEATMDKLVARADAVVEWIRQLAQRDTVYFPQPAGERSFRFEPVTATIAVDFSTYRPTIVPPVKKLMPAWDELWRFRRTAAEIGVTPSLDTGRRILCGVRSCDLKAVTLLDAVQADGVRDPHYWARRDHTAIVAIDCGQPCDERAFCQATGALGHQQGADVYLTPVEGGSVVVEPLTPRGEDLLETAKFAPSPKGPALLAQAARARPQAFGRQFEVPVEKLPGLLRQQYKSALWERHTTKCFSCGTCTMVCPTCYCFDVKDDLGLDLAAGNRVRTWDSCMLPQFAIVAGGHNFRSEASARQRHRVKRKFEYLMERFGLGSFCVGCGRCGRQCTTHIDIYDIVTDVAAAASGPPPIRRVTATGA
jgi:sulfhydrogenase subunit beta (sulfur reductase)